MNTARAFVKWLGQTHRSVSHRGSMSVEYHPSSPDEADLMLADFEKDTAAPEGYRKVLVLGGPQAHAGTEIVVKKDLRYLILEVAFDGRAVYSIERMPVQAPGWLAGYVWVARHEGTEDDIALRLLLRHLVRLADGEVRP